MTEEVITMREYIDREILALIRYVDIRFEAESKATLLVSEKIDAHFIAVFASNDLATKNVDIRLQAIDKAITIANAALDKRLEGMNEFRDQLKAQAATFSTRTEVDQQFAQTRITHATLDTRLQAQERNAANLAGRFTAVAGVIAFLSFATSIALHFIK